MIPIKAEFPEKLAPLFKPYPFKTLYGGRDGVKSWSIARALLIIGADPGILWPGRKEGPRILCGRETMDSIRESVHQLLSDQIANLGLDNFYTVLQSEIRGANGAEIMFAGLRKQSVSSLKSYEAIDIFWGEEASTVSRRSLTILLPTIRKAGSEIWWSLNPDLETDAVYQDFVINPPPNSFTCKTSYLDNNWLSPESRQKIALLRERDPDTYHHVYEGATRSTVEGAIYKQEIQAAEKAGRIRAVPYLETHPVDTYFDLGYGDRVSIWAVQRVPFETRIIRYYQDDHQPIGHYLKEMQSWGYVLGTCWLPWDGATKELGTGKSIEDVMRSNGFKVRIARRLEVHQGINAVRTLFPQLWFDANLCADGLHYLRRYQWGPETSLGVKRREPLHDDACFHPETKVLTRYGRRRIMELDQEGEVLTPCGWKHYTNLGITRRNAPLVEVAFSDGYTVKCTPEHLFMTESGWKSAESLTKGTRIRFGSIPSRSILTVTSFVYGLAKRTCAQAADRFIEKLGNLHLELSRSAATYIIGTGIRSTIYFPTWNACRAENIFNLIGRKSTKDGQSLHLPEKRPSHGMDPMWEGSGISGKQSDAKSGYSGSAKKSLASGVRIHFRRLSARVEEAVNSVLNPARVLRITNVSRMAQSSDVCCLHVEDGNWFCLENGAIVHNSHPADALRTLAVGITELTTPKPPKAAQPRMSAWS